MINLLAPLVGGIVNKFVDRIPDGNARAEAKEQLEQELVTAANSAMMAQIELNKNDAQGNWFQSSWRPLTGYVCVLGFGVNFLVSPIAAGFGVVIPQADTSTMMPVLMGLLGLGGLRSFEKTKGVEGK